MGLESLPISNILEPNSTPLSDCQSFKSSHYKAKNLKYFQDPQILHSEVHFTEPNPQKAVQKPIKKFQTENLPPKSAKSVPITRHNLLSPIKSSKFIPRNSAAQIIEAAARIIEQRPDISTKTTAPKSKSSSVPLKVNGLKKTAQKPSDSNAAKHLKGHSMNKSTNSLVDSEESSVGAKSKGKSVSLALLAKVNVQKREALHSNSRKETSEINPSRVFTSQSGTLKKQTTQKGTNVLHQNNQKQNCAVDRKKSHLKSELQNEKALYGEISSARQQSANKLAGPSKPSSKKSGPEVTKDDQRRVIRKKKRPIDAHNLSKGKNGEVSDSSGVTNVVSFTFAAPMTRIGPGPVGPAEVGEKCRIVSADSPSKRILLDSEGVGHNIRRGDIALSTSLEHKLKELNHKREFSRQKNGTVSFMSLNMVEEKDEYYTDDTKGQHSSLYTLRDLKGLETDRKCQGQLEETGTCVNMFSNRPLLDFRLTSPVSVLENFSITESCNSSDTADSNSAGGGNKHCSSIQFDADAVLSDSPSSTLTSPQRKKPRNWELEYINELLRDIDLTMFHDYALGNVRDIINPHLFDQLETRKKYSSACGNISRTNTRLIFDCVNECLDLRCRRYVIGGYKLWAKGARVVKRKDKLAEDVYKQISGWGAMGHCMVDEIVYDDMSGKNGRWVDYDIEAFELAVQIESRVLSALIDEVVDDILVL